MRILKLLLNISILIAFSACSFTNKKSTQSQNADKAIDSVEVKYAKGFSIQNFEGFRLVDIQDPSGESDIKYHYALVPRGTNPTIPADYERIEVPIRSVICMTSLQISNFYKLKAEENIVGITSTRFLFNEKINEQLKSGKTRKIGIEGEFDAELVLALNPDVILVSPFKRGGYDAIRNLGVPLVSFLGYKEISPLGQAEWIKFTAALLGTDEVAEKEFNHIEKSYLELKAMVKDVEHRPTVLSGELHSGNWYVVGGESYLAQLFRDAGAQYFMKNNNESGGYYVDFETVYAQGADAEYWRILNSFNGEFDYEMLEKADARYKDFKAFKDRKVIYCNLRDVAFYEKSTVEPHLVLADLIKIFHPKLLIDYVPVFYKPLKEN